MIDDAAETRSLVRDHNPARWLANDGLCHIAPNDLVQPRMTTGAHHDRIDAWEFIQLAKTLPVELPLPFLVSNEA